MKLVISAEARTDLFRIGDYIALDNPSRAASFVKELAAKCRTLTSNPLMYPVVPRYERSGIRRAVHGNYLIFYRVDHDSIVVLHVLASAMDYESILFPRDPGSP
jgi:plasmid stabilization system protein ParE